MQNHTIYDNLPVVVVISDLHMNIEYVNNEFINIFGYSCEEVYSQNVKILMFDDMASKHDKYAQRYLKTGKSNVIGTHGRSVIAKHKNGHKLFLRMSLFKSDGIFGALFTDEIEARTIIDNVNELICTYNVDIQSGSVDYNSIENTSN